MIDIVTKVFPGIFKCTVAIRDCEQGYYREEKVPFKDLASFIVSQENVRDVHLFGAEKYVKKIQEECLTKYTTNNIPNFLINSK